MPRTITPESTSIIIDELRNRRGISIVRVTRADTDGKSQCLHAQRVHPEQNRDRRADAGARRHPQQIRRDKGILEDPLIRGTGERQSGTDEDGSNRPGKAEREDDAVGLVVPRLRYVEDARGQNTHYLSHSYTVPSGAQSDEKHDDEQYDEQRDQYRTG